MTTKPSAREVEAVRGRIGRESPFAAHVLMTIYRRQRPEEQIRGEHLGHDGRGFTEHDSHRLNRLAWRLEDGHELTVPEAEEIRNKCQKYARQFVAASRERLAPRERREESPRRRSQRRPRRQASPERGADDSLAFLRELPMEERMEAINRMADRMGV